jgi:hypothetical protein
MIKAHRAPWVYEFRIYNKFGKKPFEHYDFKDIWTSPLFLQGPQMDASQVFGVSASLTGALFTFS